MSGRGNSPIAPPVAPLVALVGPSGAGKDSLLARVRERFADDPRVHVARRVVTRPSEPGGEPHESVDEATFDRRLARGDFVVDWEAHGLRYGVPADVCARVADGCLVVVNGSRAALPRFASAFPSLVVVHVTVDAATLAARLAARGREGEAEIRARLERAPSLDTALVPRLREIDNSGSLEAAAARLIGWLEELRTHGVAREGREGGALSNGSARRAPRAAPAARSRR